MSCKLLMRRNWTSGWELLSLLLDSSLFVDHHFVLLTVMTIRPLWYNALRLCLLAGPVKGSTHVQNAHSTWTAAWTQTGALYIHLIWYHAYIPWVLFWQRYEHSVHFKGYLQGAYLPLTFGWICDIYVIHMPRGGVSIGIGGYRGFGGYGFGFVGSLIGGLNACVKSTL